MTNEIPTPPVPPADRARIEHQPQAKRLDALPVLYLVGFLILAAALIWLWQHPVLPRTAALEVARMDALRQQVDVLGNRVAQLEARPAPAPAPNLAPIEARIAELERRPIAAPAAPPAPPPNLAPIEARLAAVEARLQVPPPAPPPPTDLGPLERRIDATAKQAADATASLTHRVDQLEARVGSAETSGKKAAAGIDAASDQAVRAVRLQAAAAALESGQSLGVIPNAPPALARFASTPPPTVASLRLAFPAAAAAAHDASQPDITEGKPFLTRAWMRAQQAVTVRQGDKVLVGDPVAGVLEHARVLVDAGDIPGAIKVLDGLSPSAKTGMAGWLAQAKALVDARAALAEMAART